MGVLFSRDKTTSGIAAMLLRIANLPIKKAFGLAPRRASPKRTRYSGEQLREIRARKGVGRPVDRHNLCVAGRIAYRPYPSYWASCCGEESPNYAEWVFKPRRKARGPAA